MTQIKIGDVVYSNNLPEDSSFTEVQGVVVGKRNGFLELDVKLAVNRWDKTKTPKPVVSVLTLSVREETAKKPRF